MTLHRFLLPAFGCAAALVAQPAPDRASRTADLLVAADRADGQASHKARRELAQTIAALDRLGARADVADAAGAAALADWHAKAGGALPPERGRVLGPAFRRGWLAPGAALSVDQLFLAGQSASVAVAATPGQGVRLAVTGPDAAPACADRACRWTPLYTQRYTITVRNAGVAGARYYLVVD